MQKKLIWNQFFLKALRLVHPLRWHRYSRSILKVFCLFIALIYSQFINAGDWRWGATIGLGGQGINKQANMTTGQLTLVQRSEGPLVSSIFVDQVILKNWTWGFEHSRGLRIAPFSSGIGFTSTTFRWFYMAPPIDLNPNYKLESSYIQKRWAPYIGLAVGLAIGEARREVDFVPAVSESGLHGGLKIGGEYLYLPSLGLRAELSAQQTLFQNAIRPGLLREFSLSIGFFRSLF